MKEIRILYLYPDMLELYGDFGNIQVLKYRIEKRGMRAKIDQYSLGDKAPDFSKYDIVFSGGGADNEQTILAEDLLKYRENIKKAVNSGVFFLLICGSYQLFGKYYKGVAGEKIPGLAIFDYYTEANPDRRKRCIGNIVVETEIDGEKYPVIGFENHGGQTFGVAQPFGKVLRGNGNKFEDDFEGFRTENVIATYLHGPLLAKNPRLTDYIISYCLLRKYEDGDIAKLDDEFEERCREQLLG